MHTKTVKLDATKIDSTQINKAATLVDAGGLVAFPTETVYGIACRVKSDSLARLNDIKGRESNKYYTLHIGQKSDVNKYVPTIGLRIKKLIKNAWPGPLTIVFALDRKDIDKQKKKLEKEVFEELYNNTSIGIRCPDDAVAAMLLQAIHNPVVAPSANIAGQPPAFEADEVLAQLSGQIELLLDAGACKYKKSSTVVKIGKTGLEILRPGVFSQADLETMSTVNFLFVCTGNTCRSPMAEWIFRKYLAEKLRCKVDQLHKIGYKVSSAGVMDMAGLPASAGAITACSAKGIEITAHGSKGLTKELIEQSDLIFAMERIHWERIISLVPGAADKCFLLAGDKGISDPIGHPQEFFNSCAEMIEASVKERISEFVI